MPTTGLLRGCPPIEPWKAASPKANNPPSVATFQYPFPSPVAAMPTIGWLRWPGAGWLSHPVSCGFWWYTGHERLPRDLPLDPTSSQCWITPAFCAL